MRKLNYCKLQVLCNLRKKVIFTLLTIIPFWSFSQTFNGTGGAIPDGGAETCFNVSVTGVGVINATTGLTTVCLNATHTFDGDLDIYLVAPDGSRVELSTDNGSSSDNYTNTCFTMSAATNITAGTAPFTGNFKPEGTFATVNNGQNANGTWKICITDDSSSDIGSLGAWSITFGAITGGTGTTITGCTGNFYDSGGASGNYGLNETNIVTYCPSAAGSKMTLDFTAFNTESGFDLLNVYDGTSTAATSLGNFTGNSYSLPFTVIATNANASGCLTFEFISDDLVVKAGWAAAISCSQPCQQVLSVYNGSTPATVGGYINICPGATVTFTANGSYPQNNAGYAQSDATSIFVWDFGDGTTATGKTVTHTFTTAGGYDVDLNITDVNGCKSTNDLGIRVRVATDPSFAGTIASPITICQGKSTTLTGVATPTPWTKPTGQSVAGTTFLPDGSGTSYSTSLVFDEFNPGATVTNVNDIVNICANIEHSWSSDLELNITCPDGTTVQLKNNDGGNVFLGEPVDNDAVLTAGDGYDYCWQMTATYPNMTTYAAGTPATHTYTDNAGTLVSNQAYYPAGSYVPTQSFAGLIGCPLNGTWTIKVTDHIGSDNGYIFSWGINFAPSLYPVLWGFTPTISTQTWTGPGNPTAGNPATVTPPALGANVYTYTVVDNYGCSHDTTVTVNVIGFTLTKSQVNVTCFGGTNGTATVTVTGGGTPNYSYHWSGGTPLNTNNTTSTNNTVTGLAAGVYTVTVTDGGSCTNTATVTITAPTQITFPTSMTSAVCGACNGSATVGAITGGTGSYTYAWSNSTTANPAINLCAGNYTVSVKDASNCISTAIVTVTGTGAVTAGFTVNNGHQCLTGNTFTFTNTGTTGGGITYSWNFGDTQTGTGSPVSHTYTTAGTYTVTQTVTQGTCTATQTMTIYVHPHPTVTITPTPATCLNLCDGSALANASGASIPYTYAWSNSTSANPAIGLCDGTYTVTVTDNWGCKNTQSVTITEPTGITLNPTRTDANCNGDCNGSANVIASGGSGSYSYLWSNGGSNATINSLCAGNYTVSVFDANSAASCYQTVTVVVGQPTILATTNTVNQNINCNGGNNGSATINVTGGTLSYTYLWPASAANQTTANVTNLTAGTYIVTTTDSHGCKATTTVSITQPVLLTASAVVNQNVSCFGGNNGSATITASGGTPIYSYLWPASAGNQTNANITNLTAGTYIVTITDTKSCYTTVSVPITQPIAALTVATSGTNLNCNSVCNGTISAVPSGGTPAYSYLWNNGGGSLASASGICAGTYTITVTDTKGCTATSTVTITQPTTLNATTAINQQVNCFGGNNGSATVTATGGTIAYSYLWPATAANQTTANATNLIQGSYIVTVTDANGCKATATATITQPTILNTTIVINQQVSCFGGNNGSATVSVSGGTTAYTYAWPASAANQTTANATNLIQGSYIVTVTDANGCKATATATITQPTLLAANISSSTNINCFGGNNGSATINTTGGVTNYTYAWPASAASQTTVTATNLTQGTYIVTVTDANGCKTTATAVITQPLLLTAAAAVNQQVSCFGGNNGSATITAANGTPAYTYSWPASAGNQTNATVSNLSLGTYVVTITDSKTCYTTVSISITQPSLLTVATSGTNLSCNGVCNGTISAVPSGGTAAYTYLWNNGGGTSSSATNICAGNYTITVTDTKGCTATSTVTVTQPSLLTASSVGTPATCNGVCNGTATVTATGGTSGYTYLWNDALFQTVPNATGLCVGTYNVTITDLNNCKTTSSYIVTEPTAIALTSGSTNATCGNPTGSATVTATGGTTPYSYTWSNGVTGTNTLINILAGSYTVTVTDLNSCSKIIIIPVNNNGSPTATIASSTNVLCFGGNNGSATVTATSGTGAYTYNWSPSGGSGATASNLISGNYTVTVTDALGCLATASVSITQPAILNATISTPTNVLCNGGNNGSATVSVSGGTTIYTYAWPASAASQNTATASNLLAGTYIVTVTDANGCIKTATTTITQPTALTATTAVNQQVSCFGGNNGSVTVTATGGVTNYNYAWPVSAASQTTAIATNLTQGTYVITITDANNCTTTTTATINQPLALIATTTINQQVSCFGGNNGTATVTATNGTPVYSYTWPASAANQNTATASNLLAGTYIVTVTDANNCTTTTTATITQPLALTATTTIDQQVNCFGGNNGAATVTATNGTPVYSYTWPASAANQNTATASNLLAGTYIVTVTDANSCTTTTTATITQPLALTATIAPPTNILCNGGNNGSATVTATGGTGAYTYNWSPSGGSGATASNLISGNYTVSVTDVNACLTTATVSITQPVALTASIISTTNILCNGGNNGSATVSASGGTIAYTYAWPVSAASQTTAIANNLLAGTYIVTLTDANSCATTATATITQPSTLSATITINQQVSCNGGNNGNATITATNGTPIYTYAWPATAASQTTATATNLAQGTYIATVTDANGCTKTATTIITEPILLGSNISTTTNISCFGGSNGSATVVATNGTPTYSYTWPATAANQNTATATNLLAGTYITTVTDANGCTSTATAIITEPTLLTAAITTAPTNVSCFGGNNGSATVSATGGTINYSYAWPTSATNQTTTTAINLSAGAYTVTVTDANGCMSTTTATITQPTQLIASASLISNAHCGQSDGSITVSATGGTITTGYTYIWSDPLNQTTATAINLPANTYVVTVTDNNGCSSTSSVKINDIEGISSLANITVIPTCNGNCDGQITINATGGATPYNYIWSTAAISQTTQTATELCAGTYSVTVTDANNCSLDTSIIVGQPTILTATITASTNISCNGGNNGSATVIANGGTPHYDYSWSTIPTQTTDVSNNLTAGTYTVSITDANNCLTTANVTITEPTPVTLTTTSTPENCGRGNGSATVVASGGTQGIAPNEYTYQWYYDLACTNPIIGANQATVTGLHAGTYYVKILDGNGCTAIGAVTITNIPGGIATISAYSNVTCNTACNGSATVSIGGGVAPYIYSWSNGQNTNITSNLCPGVYVANITDANLCVATASVTITEPTALTNSFTFTNVQCNGGSTGSITANPFGGISPYSYQWNAAAASQTTQTATNLISGTYQVTIFDSNNCNLVTSISITQPTAIVVSENITNSNCGQSNGNIDITVSGGSSPYSYYWDNFATSQDLNNIVSGAYLVTITDNNGCKKIQSYSVNDIAGPTVSISNINHVTCNSLCDGVAALSVTGNVLPLNIIWNDPSHQITQTATNLCAGTYSVTIADPAGCIASTSVTINQPPQLTITTNYTQPSCNGGNNGTASVIALGGTPNYLYTWTGGGLNPSAPINTGLSAGNYTISVQDANGCKASQLIVVDQPTFISLTTSTTNALCSGACNGAATVTATGGTPNYSYIWSDGQTTQTAIGLCAGNYTVTVTDSHNCSELISVIIYQPTAVSINVTQVQHVSCFGGNDGFILTNASGGTPNYNYSWGNGSNSQNINGLSWGNYLLTVTDANNCSVQTTVVISQPPVLAVQLNSINENCFGTCDGSISSIVNGGTPSYTYQWSNLQSSSSISGLCPNTYTLTITDSKGCSTTAQKIILGPQALNITIANVQPTHCGLNEGLAQITIQGGTGNVSIHWSNNGTTLTQTNLAGGLYGVTVTDQNGCTDIEQINVNDIDGPVITNISSTNVNCFGELNGSATVTYTSVAPVSSVIWNDPLHQASASASGLAAANYSVLITDINGCVASGNALITQPSQLLSIISSKTNTTCNGDTDGSITVTAGGGSPAYLYAWSDGQNTPVASNLSAGSYNVTITDTHGCKATSTAVITQPMPIVINGTITNANCNESSDGIISLTVQGGTPTYSYTWMPAVSTNSVAADLHANTYNVIITDNHGCQQSAQYNVTQPAPLLVYTSTQPITCGSPNGSAWIDSIVGGNGNYHYIWSPGNFTTNTIDNLAAGNYQLQVFDGQNCSVIKNVTVAVVDPPQLFSSQTSPVSCYSGNNGTAEVIIKYGTPPYNYAWAPYGGISSTATNLAAGNYSVTATDAKGCTVITTVVVTEPAPVIAHANGTATICIGQSTNITASAQGGSSEYSFTWNNGLSSSQAQTVSPTITTTYTVYATDHNGCVSPSASVTVYVNPQIQAIISSTDTIVCQSDSTLLIASATGGNGGPYSYHWIGSNETVKNIYVSPTVDTQYGVVVTDGCGTPSDTAYFMIYVKKAPEIIIVSNIVEGCEPLVVIFNNAVDNGSDVVYNWNFGDIASGPNNTSNNVNTTHEFTTEGQYSISLTATSAEGCQNSVVKPNLINVYPLPEAAFNADPLIVSVLHANIEFTDFSSGDIEQWSWIFGDNYTSYDKNPAHSYSKPGNYTVLEIVQTEHGCLDTTSKVIIVKEEVTFYAPTAFSPGGDGINDTWFPKGIGIVDQNYHLYVFDRWGEQIFETDYYSEDPLDKKGHWNGCFNNVGEKVQIGSYIWLVRFEDINSNIHEYSGTVTIIR